jgi:hypothetical protein
MALFPLMIAVLTQVPAAPATGTRLVAWRPKPGHEREFEEGYRQHLQWHRAHHDQWLWRGWTFSTGDREGTFIDGTFAHPWSHFDAPVDPAGDGADNRANVEPHADATQVMVLEQLASRGTECLDSPLLTFVWLTLSPGDVLTTLPPDDATCAVLFRPVSGSAEQLVVLGARKPSALRLHAAAVDQVARAARAERLQLTALRTETARLREELTYRP